MTHFLFDCKNLQVSFTQNTKIKLECRMFKSQEDSGHSDKVSPGGLDKIFDSSGSFHLVVYGLLQQNNDIQQVTEKSVVAG